MENIMKKEYNPRTAGTRSKTKDNFLLFKRPFVPNQSKVPSALLWLFIITVTTWPNVTMNKIFSSNMVLQHGMPVPVWGIAGPGENVSVQFDGQTKTSIAGANGSWKIILDSMTINNSSLQMIVKGVNSITFTNILVGEVWLCSGQSNMAHDMNFFGADTNLAAGMNNIRLSNGAAWAECNPTTASSFSATAFFYGKALYDSLKIPVGLITEAVGGTIVERWMSTQSIIDDPDLDTSTVVQSPAKAGDLYRGSIAPLIPFAFRGVIWYQGETNAQSPYWPDKYQFRFKELIDGWRNAWGNGDFPFYYVQLPNYELDQFLIIREAQRLTLSNVQNTGMAITIDIGDSMNLHPTDKADVGYRLALIALDKTYGHSNLVSSGPLFKDLYITGDTAHLSFDYVGLGLVAKGGQLSGFEIASTDTHFVAATAVIIGNQVLVYKPGSKVINVRYAWAPNPKVTLYNKEGLPASPFKTYSSDFVGIMNNTPIFAKENFNAGKTITSMKVFDLAGRCVLAVTGERTEMLARYAKVNMFRYEKLPTGVYMVQMWSNNGVIGTEKIVRK
jgi:sialate O-acetylesterase